MWVCVCFSSEILLHKSGMRSHDFRAVWLGAVGCLALGSGDYLLLNNGSFDCVRPPRLPGNMSGFRLQGLGIRGLGFRGLGIQGEGI